MKKPKAAAVNEENAAAEVAAKEAANKVVAIETSVIADQSSSTATCSSSAALNTSATSSLGSDKQETPATTQPPQFTLAQIAAQAVESRRASQLLSRISESSSVSQRGDEAATSSGSEASFPVHHNRTVATGSSSSKQTPKLNPRSSLVDHSHHHHHHHHHHHNLHARLATRKSSLDLPSSTQLLNAVANSSAIAASAAAAAAAAAATPASISNPITSRYVQQQQQYLQQQQQLINPQTATATQATQATAKQQARKSIDPSQVFLQLYQQAPYLHGGGEQQQQQQRDTPLLIPEGEATINRAMYFLDVLSCCNTHKIGVLYVGKEQAGDERAILCNATGSPRYKSFLSGLGNLVHLKGIDNYRYYAGGLEDDGSIGEFTLLWTDGIMQMAFHVATMMLLKDDELSSKKRHIGNDSVIIVFNESGEEYQFNMIKVQHQMIQLFFLLIQKNSSFFNSLLNY